MRRIFWELLKTDLQLLLLRLKDKAIDALIWSSVTIVIIAYVLPEFGLKNFGTFQAATIIISIMGFEINSQLYSWASGIEYRKHLFYLFTLPVPNWLIFLQKVVLFTINGIILGLIVLPTMKFFLRQEMNLLTISWWRLGLTLIVSSFFFSCLSLFLLGFVKRSEQVEHLLMRLIFPMWFLGGFQFSWLVLYKINSYLGWFSLLSPYTYANEAARSSILGPENFLSFWLCISILSVGSVVLGYQGYLMVKRKVDLI